MKLPYGKNQVIKAYRIGFHYFLKILGNTLLKASGNLKHFNMNLPANGQDELTKNTE